MKDGVIAYQTVGPPPSAQTYGSVGAWVASVVSTVAWYGNVVTGVAFSQASFGGGAERAAPVATSISATVRPNDERRRMVFPPVARSGLALPRRTSPRQSYLRPVASFLSGPRSRSPAPALSSGGRG